MPSKRKNRRRRPSKAVTHCSIEACGEPFRRGEAWLQVGPVERVHTRCLKLVERKGSDSKRDADGRPVKAAA